MGATATGGERTVGVLTDKSSISVTQIKLGDLDSSNEEGSHIRKTEMLYNTIQYNVLYFERVNT